MQIALKNRIYEVISIIIEHTLNNETKINMSDIQLQMAHVPIKFFKRIMIIISIKLPKLYERIDINE